jgi:hypothetical protein
LGKISPPTIRVKLKDLIGTSGRKKHPLLFFFKLGFLNERVETGREFA